MGAAATRLLRFFVDPPLSAFVSLVFSLSFLLGVTVLFPPQHLSLDGSVGCFVYKAGGNPFSVMYNSGKVEVPWAECRSKVPPICPCSLGS